MLDYLRRIGYKPDDLNKLNVVHITGTKGKGSTSAFAERILRDQLGGKIGKSGAPSDIPALSSLSSFPSPSCSLCLPFILELCGEILS